MSSKWVRVGSVRRFDLVSSFKPQALMPLERAADVYQAWKEMASAELAHGGDCVLARLWRKRLLDECANVIQATLNLVSAMGVEDFRPLIKACEERNRERGRITK